MMKTWTFADAMTGLFTGTTFSTYSSRAEAELPANTREGWIAVEGSYDHLSQRVDLETGEVVDYQPPQPDDDHEWNVTSRRWLKRADVLQREQQRAQAQARIEALERQQHRRVRELLASSDPQLKAIDDEIVQLRAQLIAR